MAETLLIPPATAYHRLLPPRYLEGPCRDLHWRKRWPYVSCSASRNSISGSKLKEAKVVLPPQLSTAELQEKLGCPALMFRDVGGLTVAEMKLSCGSSARILLQQARITSFKHLMWHGGVEELLHTDVSTESDEGSFVVTGGMLPSFSHSPCNAPLVGEDWRLESAKINPDDYIQIILRCPGEHMPGTGGGTHYLQSIISLSKSALALGMVIINSAKRPTTFTGSVSTELAVSVPEAVNVVGLKGCRFFSPSEAQRSNQEGDLSFFGRLKRLVRPSVAMESNYVSTEQLNGDIADQQVNITEDQSNWFSDPELLACFKHILHRIYSTPPQAIRISDEGLRRSLVIEQEGFENLILASPGLVTKSDQEASFVSIGSASVLSPFMLGPGERWRAAQILVPDS